MGAVTRGVLAAIAELAGPVEIDLTPQEVPWSTPLDEDEEHARYDHDRVATYFEAATRAALVLAEFRAPYRGRNTPVNAWWGSSTSPSASSRASPPSRRRTTSSCATRWTHRTSPSAGGLATPTTPRLPSTPTHTRRQTRFSDGKVSPATAHWDAELGLYVLDWDDVLASADPHAAALEFARSVFAHACTVCEWDPTLAASVDGTPPPVV